MNEKAGGCAIELEVGYFCPWLFEKPEERFFELVGEGDEEFAILGSAEEFNPDFCELLLSKLCSEFDTEDDEELKLGFEIDGDEFGVISPPFLILELLED